MKRNFNMFSMVQAITVLTILKMLANAQTTCNGNAGRIVYERLPDQQLQGFDDEVVRDSAPPFRVLEKCQDLCLRDRTAGNNLPRACASFDFQPGSRLASFSGTPEYEESTCYLTREQAQPEGIGNLMLVPNSVHFTEVCLTSNRIERDCPNRRYIFERHPRKKLKLPMTDVREVPAANRTVCEESCLNEYHFVCRSATFDAVNRNCLMSRFTRRTHPELLEDDPNTDYLENTCLNADRRCDGLTVFIKEENRRLRGPFEVDIYTNLTLEECQNLCLRADKYFCRSVEFDEQTRQCVISEEDSVSQKDDIGTSNSPSYHFYDLVCLDNPSPTARGSEYPDNSVSGHYPDSRRPDTAFQRYRNSRLSGEFHSEITGRSLSECLDECLRQTSFQCRSAVYSEHLRSCRLSRFNQRDGHRIIYDADFDYYENLMHQYLDGDRDNPMYRPDPVGQGTNFEKPSLGRPGHPDDYDKGYPSGSHGDRYPDYYPPPGDRYPGSKYPNQYPDDRYPDKYPDRYPSDRYPLDRYPHDRYPSSGDRYPADRYPVPSDRYPASGDRYPSDRYPVGDRYPGDRYPASDRYPVGGDRYPVGGDRYPGGGDRYPISGDRYPISGDRYPVNSDRYPINDRYPVNGDNYPLINTPGYHRYPPPPVYPSSGHRYPSGPGSRYPVKDEPYHPGSGTRYPIPDDPLTRYPTSGINRIPSRYPNDRYPDKDPYPFRDRYPGAYPNGYEDDIRGTKGFADRPGYYSPGGVAGAVRPGPPGAGAGAGAGYPEPSPDNFMAGVGVGGGVGDTDPYNSVRPIGSGGGTIIGRPPLLSRCDEQENFRQVGSHTRVRKPFVRRYTTANTLTECERECADARDFVCRSFNFRAYAAPYGAERDNCELSDRDSRDMAMNNPIYYDTSSDYDFYERNSARQGADGECLDVSQVCSEDGMEFTLRTPDGFIGRIYTYGYYDRCFFRGNGGTVNVLRISGPQGYPECGTQRYGDTMTNIVVVQFSDYVQTGRDKRFNLTCLFRGPGEAVVTSGYIGAGRSGSPIPIEYLPAENTLSSRVRLMILYQGRPTTTIAVGDPLTFRLEAQDGYNYVTDIFATNVIARDPYSGRSVQLIDRYGCPVDNYVFPGLDRLREGDSLEARFNAFKIPESNFLVFEATVRSCRDGCQPAYCSGSAGRSEPSFGKRRRRSLNGTTDDVLLDEHEKLFTTKNDTELIEDDEQDDPEEAEEEHVREMIEVLDSRYDMDDNYYSSNVVQKQIAPVETICITPNEYYGLVTAIVGLAVLLSSVVVLSLLIYRKYGYPIIRKNKIVDKVIREDSASSRSNFSFMRSGLPKPFQSTSLSQIFNHQLTSTAMEGAVGLTVNRRSDFDPSEPIYTDPSLFEVSRDSLHQSNSARNENLHLI
ncbi:uncharacterized protein LOC123264688 isoform X1 [Cotesia glomerata]|uniref:uncharacterized protein LOC123264688 isoform X1 n=1 Tax=Cotesia glomerata TaxID=32391 RepID=UPI001D026FD3|nr:uncharacterized protein LOC123264688 isoform X1 [Cotesia glomerata]XP_044584055.1 uncharacterized protein LOC123264688 isoform X1 [Cotesia glomerata]